MTAQPLFLTKPNSVLPIITIPGLTEDEAAGFVHNLVHREGVSPRTVARRIQEVLNFLSHAGNQEDRHIPTHRVDVIWHNMILHTQWYPRLCAALGRGYIHHRPNDYRGVKGDKECDDKCDTCECYFD